MGIKQSAIINWIHCPHALQKNPANLQALLTHRGIVELHVPAHLYGEYLWLQLLTLAAFSEVFEPTMLFTIPRKFCRRKLSRQCLFMSRTAKETTFELTLSFSIQHYVT
jgi:hypothetical protein